MSNTITLEKKQEAERRLAEIVAQLVREGIAFDVLDAPGTYIIHCTGGF